MPTIPPCPLNINLISGETSKISETNVSSVIVKKDALTEIVKILQGLLGRLMVLRTLLFHLMICWKFVKLNFCKKPMIDLNDQFVMTIKLLTKSLVCMVQYN